MKSTVPSGARPTGPVISDVLRGKREIMRAILIVLTLASCQLVGHAEPKPLQPRDLVVLWRSMTNLESAAAAVGISPEEVTVKLVEGEIQIIRFLFSTNAVSFVSLEVALREKFGPPATGQSFQHPYALGWSFLHTETFEIRIREVLEANAVEIELQDIFVPPSKDDFVPIRTPKNEDAEPAGGG